MTHRPSGGGSWEDLSEENPRCYRLLLASVGDRVGEGDNLGGARGVVVGRKSGCGSDGPRAEST